MALTEKYNLLMYWVHSQLEQRRGELIIEPGTEVENFTKITRNDKICDKICEDSLSAWNYELSMNQLYNGINLFLMSNKNQ